MLKGFVYSPYCIPPLISALIFFSLGLFVLLKNKRSSINISFSLFCFATFWWQFSWFILFNFPNSDPANDAFAAIMVKVGYTGINFIAVTMLHFIVVFFNFRKHLKFVYIIYGMTFVLLVLLWTTDTYIHGFYRYFFGYYPRAGFLHLAHLVVQLVLGGIYGYILNGVAMYRFRKDPFRFNQAKYVFLAMVIYFPAATDYLVNWGYEFYPFGFICITITASILAFTIIRYRLMEIETVMHRTFLWVLTVSFLIVPFGVVFEVLKKRIFSLGLLVVVMIMTLTLMVFLGLYRKLKPAIDRFFRRRKYDYYIMLSDLPSRIGSSLDIDVFNQGLFKELKEILYVRNSLILIKAPGHEDFEEVFSSGYDELRQYGFIRSKKEVLGMDHPLVLWQTRMPRVLEREQVEIDPQYQEIREKGLEFFQRNSVELLIPLTMGKQLIALLGLGKKENLQAYTVKDIELLGHIGHQIGITIDNALHHENVVEKERIAEELRLGRQIQMSLLPRDPPDFPHLSIQGLMQPANEIGGDYYDFIRFPDKDHLGIVIGDVSGKGVGAGLLMAMVKTAIYIFSHQETSSKQTLIKINSILDRHIGGEKFMSMIYLIWQASRQTLTYTSAGHEYILLFRRGAEEIEAIESGGMLLGIMPDIAGYIEEKEIKLSAGDKIMLYTDGVTEALAPSRTRFGLERLKSSFFNHRQGSAREIMQAVQDEVHAFMASQTQYDDITLLVLEAV